MSQIFQLITVTTLVKGPNVKLFNINFPYPFYFLSLSSKYSPRHELLTPHKLYPPLRATQVYCIVVGSRRLMPPDALQPKAYCTNPGL